MRPIMASLTRASSVGVVRGPVSDLPVTLESSFKRCKALNREHGTSYYWATLALPRIKQPHVHALYGLCRYADEIVDAIDARTDADRSQRLDDLEQLLMFGLAQRRSDHPILKAVVCTAGAFNLPDDAFRRFFAAMRSDLTVSSYATYDELLGYMDGSAAVIGELMLPILEPTDPAAWRGARDLGVAFQLTNFLRDVGEDLDRGRVYFPAEELARFGVDIHARVVDERWRAFCNFQMERMRALYRSADDAIEMLPASSAGSIRTARIIYSEILDRIVANDFDVFTQRARVPLARKLTVAVREYVRR
jgi:15-cis-phytoene synthase